MLGILYALGALFSWAFGDLFIQKTSRILGIWKALFFITFFGFAGLFPLIKDEIPILMQNTENLIMLLVAVVIVLFAALFDFEALKEGKFAVVEPILGIELPITVALSLFILKENISLLQGILIFLTFIGIVLAVTTKIHRLKYHKRILEKGVIIALIAAVAMALTNFIIGISSQKTSPIMAIWFTHTALLIVSSIYLLFKKEFFNLLSDFKKNAKVILPESILDNTAWVLYAYSMTLIPISIATAISESYIALGLFLGLFINKEKLKKHQILGAVIAVISIIILSWITN